ncbi:MAG: nucleotidyltransferase family protein, partial [Acidithiobacillales bacterium]
MPPSAFSPTSAELSLGARGFDHERLFSSPDLRRYSEVAVSAVSTGSASPLLGALGTAPKAAALELAAFAASVQGMAPLLATLGDVGLLPAPLVEFFLFERSASAVRGKKLLRTLEETHRALAGSGIETVALKGAALLLRGDAEPELRPMGDLDLLLVAPERIDAATRALERRGWKPRFDTPRHRVFVRPDERVARPACEDPENPIRIELHTNFRIPVLGRTFDATSSLVSEAATVEREGVRFLVASGGAFLRHFLFHAAGDFAASGLRGVQAHDFRLLSRRGGPLRVPLTSTDRRVGLAPLAYAAEAIEGLFPGSFEKGFLGELSREVPARLLARASALPSLRHTRPARSWTKVSLSIAESPWRKARFFLQAAFPPLGEVRVNVAPDASGAALVGAWLAVFGRRLVSAARRPGRPERDGAQQGPATGLQPGEIRIHERFGPMAVNRGAVLFECEWDGGLFESGVMLGGIFRSGSFRSGVFWAGLWKGGSWEGGFWHHGFGPDGRYRPRGAPPGASPGTAASASALSPAQESGAGLTVFAATVFPDLVRLWHACLVRALPREEAIVEVYDDSAAGDLDAVLLPGATILRRAPERPDFQMAYNDAIARATTPLLAFVDTDVFCVSKDVWRRARAELERPEVAAVSCVSREAAESPGTFAVVMKVAAYREALRSVPGGFVPFAEREAS